MKKLLLYIGILVSGCLFSQDTSAVLVNASDSTPVYMTAKSGSCASPDGGMNSIVGPPGSYAWLQTNGYCNPATYGKNPTVCWTFTPTSSAVSINSGYSQTGCNNIAFGGFNLYTSSCTLLASGLSFSGLTPGVTYTWCMSGSAWGGGPSCTGFDDFCPYYTNDVVLPVELEIFAGQKTEEYNNIYWVTATEINNSHFTLDRSFNGVDWDYLDVIDGSGTTNTPSMYDYKDYEATSINSYYRLTQTDYNGSTKTYNMIYITGTKPKKEIPVAYDTLGRIIKDPKQHTGIIIYKYSDGFWYKVSRVK